MSKRLYVGNLSYAATNTELGKYFEQAGRVIFAKVIVDFETKRSKGFGFVEMASDQETTDAITKLHSSNFDGRIITVGEAKPREPKVTSTVQE